MRELPIEQSCQINKKILNIYRRRLFLFKFTIGLAALILGVSGFYWAREAHILLRIVLCIMTIMFFVHTGTAMSNIFDRYLTEEYENPFLLLFSRPSEREGIYEGMMEVSLEEYVPSSLHITWWGKVSYRTKTKDREFLN